MSRGSFFFFIFLFACLFVFVCLFVCLFLFCFACHFLKSLKFVWGEPNGNFYQEKTFHLLWGKFSNLTHLWLQTWLCPCYKVYLPYLKSTWKTAFNWIQTCLVLGTLFLEIALWYFENTFLKVIFFLIKVFKIFYATTTPSMFKATGGYSDWLWTGLCRSSLKTPTHL